MKQGTPVAKKLSAMPVSRLPPGRLGDLSYLLQEDYEQRLRRDMKQATRVGIEKLDALKQEQAPVKI